MDSVVFESVSKKFRHRPALFNWLGKERGVETRALDEVSFKVARGSVLVLLGPNGSGKTTTLKLISTMLLPDSGRVLVEGAETRRHFQSVRRKIGFAVANERSFFPRLSARENLEFFAALDDLPRRERRDRVEAMLKRIGLLEEAGRLVMTFSAGMYQRLGIARALLKRPSLILLDEPTRSMDPASTAQFWQLVGDLPDRGVTVVLATHNFNEALALGDAVAILRQGVLVGWRRVAGTAPNELRDFYFEKTGEMSQTLDLVASF